jgi:hypothetical protein
MRLRRSPRYDATMKLRSPLAVLAFALFIAPSHAAELVYPPGSRIGLVPPAGMTASSAFQGFEDRAKGAMLVVTELSAQTYDKVAKDFAPEQMQATGMEPIAREMIALPGGDGLLVTARQSENGVAVRKFALLTRTEDMTVIVIASAPDAARDTYPDATLRDALGSVTVRPKLPPDEMLRILPYRLDDLGGFRLLRASPAGTAVLTLGPNDTTLPAEQPYFTIALRAAEMPQTPERDQFALRALTLFIGRPDVRLVSSGPVRIGGEQGHEIVAESRDPRTGDEFMLVQWLRFGTSGFVQMFGTARRDQWTAVLPRMRTLRDGFALR